MRLMQLRKTDNTPISISPAHVVTLEQGHAFTIITLAYVSSPLHVLEPLTDVEQEWHAALRDVPARRHDVGVPYRPPHYLTLDDEGERYEDEDDEDTEVS